MIPTGIGISSTGINVGISLSPVDVHGVCININMLELLTFCLRAFLNIIFTEILVKATFVNNFFDGAA